jgi:hypothetical protein
MNENQLKESKPAHAERNAPALSTADMAAAAEWPKTGRPGESQPKDKPRPAEKHATGAATTTAADEPSMQLMGSDETERFRSRWSTIQTGFVDEPRRAVEDADGLVAEVMKRLAEVFADERSKLESQWSRGDNVSTEDLRVSLRRYRSFFDRLLSM